MKKTIADISVTDQMLEEIREDCADSSDCSSQKSISVQDSPCTADYGTVDKNENFGVHCLNRRLVGLPEDFSFVDLLCQDIFYTDPK